MDNGRGKGGPKEILKPREEIGSKRGCGLGRSCSLRRRLVKGEDVFWEKGGLGEMMGPREKICF
jgi:hypothetical protein